MKLQTSATISLETIVHMSEDRAKNVLIGMEVYLVNQGYRIVAQHFTNMMPNVWNIIVAGMKTEELDINPYSDEGKSK